MEWKLTKNELPEENVYVLVHIKNEFNNCNVKNYYAVVCIEKGISEEERDKMPECPRKRKYYPGDVFGNNLVPYRWSTIGPVAFFGQEVDKWAYIDDMESLNNANPSEALESSVVLKFVDGLLQRYEGKTDYNIYITKEWLLEIKQALLKAQEKEKDKVFLKNLHNTKVRVPLVDIFNGLSREKREAYTEHIYYHWEEMKESLEAEIKYIKTEKENLESKLRKQAKLLRIILNNIELDENYNDQGSGSTKAYKLTIPNCISMEEDENYTDDCYPNSDFEVIDNFVKEESV